MKSKERKPGEVEYIIQMKWVSKEYVALKFKIGIERGNIIKCLIILFYLVSKLFHSLSLNFLF